MIASLWLSTVGKDMGSHQYSRRGWWTGPNRKDAYCSATAIRHPFSPGSAHIYWVGWTCWQWSWLWVMSWDLGWNKLCGKVAASDCWLLSVVHSSHINQDRKCHFFVQNTLMAPHFTQSKILILVVACNTPTWSGPASLTHTLVVSFCFKSSLDFLFLGHVTSFTREPLYLPFPLLSTISLYILRIFSLSFVNLVSNVTLSVRPSLTVLYKIASSDNLNSYPDFFFFMSSITTRCIHVCTCLFPPPPRDLLCLVHC